MNAVKGILRNLHRYTLWLIVSVVLWAWIFTLITDAPAQNKLLLYAEVPAMDREGLSAVLEADMPGSIRFVEARPFMDEMFSPANVAAGDVFIVSESQVENYRDAFSPLDRAAFPGRTFYEIDGGACGVCVFDEAAGIRIGTRYVTYGPGERYFLFFNAKSGHLGAQNGSRDDAALRAAQTFLTLP